MKSSLRRASFLLGLALAVGGCGDDSSSRASTPTSTPTASATALAATATLAPSATATDSPIPTATPSATQTATASPTPTATPTPTDTATSTPTTNPFVDPGSEPWEPVPAAEVSARCGLDPALLAEADAAVAHAYAVIRYGQLCHEYYPGGDVSSDTTDEIYSTTKTLGALVTGIAAYQTRDLPRTGPKTGPLSDEDRVDHWLDEFTFNPDARVAHVLAMIAHNEDLSFGNRKHQYDTIGIVQINRLSDIINTALRQDPERLGENLEEFTQRYLFAPLGMHASTWTGGSPDKIFAFTWRSTIRDMARVGLLMLHDGYWSGGRILDESWIYEMTHPSFEDANTGYGYLTWLNSASNWALGLGDPPHQTPEDPCAPLALNAVYPHGLSEATDCNYEAPYTCEQDLDVGMWYAAGLGGQFIVGHRGLDLVLVVKQYLPGPGALWHAVRPALVALDPMFHGDEEAFCAAYASGSYAPDLR